MCHFEKFGWYNDSFEIIEICFIVQENGFWKYIMDDFNNCNSQQLASLRYEVIRDINF